jgi:hypothetical protein
MMKYVRVDKAPEKLKDNEMIIEKPDFMEEIQANRKKRGVDSAATIRNIRDTFMAITDKYDNTINPFHLKLQKFDNLVYEGDKGYSEIVLKVIKENDLPLVEKVIEFELKNRKPTVDMIYYVSPDLEGSRAFLNFGFSMKSDKKSTKKSEDVV